MRQPESLSHRRFYFSLCPRRNLSLTYFLIIGGVHVRVQAVHVCQHAFHQSTVCVCVRVCVRREGCLGMHSVTSCTICTPSVSLWWHMCLQRGRETGELRLINENVSAEVCMEIGWMSYVGVTTYGRHRGRIYIMFLSKVEGALVNLQCALQLALVSGRTRTSRIRGRSDLKDGRWHQMTWCTVEISRDDLL